MNKMFRKVSSMSLAGIMMIQMMAFAVNVDVSTDDLAEINVFDSAEEAVFDEWAENVVSENATAFADEFDSSLNITETDVTPICNENDEVIGCSVSLFNEGEPCGYVNYDFSREDYITEFCIADGEQGLYDNLSEESGADTENVLYQTGALEYAVPYSDGEDTYYFDSFAGELNEQEFEALASEEDDGDELSDDGVSNVGVAGEDIDSDDEVTADGGTGYKYYKRSSSVFRKYSSDKFSCGKRTWLSKYDKEKSLPSENALIKYTGTYACAPAALTAIAAQEDLLYNNKKTTTYKKLWDTTDTFVYDTIKYTLKDNTKVTAQLGATYDKSLSSGMKNYMRTYMGKTCTTSTKKSPTYKWLTNSVDKNISSTLSYRIYMQDGSKRGHTINVVGYCNATYNGKTSPYVIVADEWHNTSARYINYNTSFVDFFSIRYTFK